MTTIYLTLTGNPRSTNTLYRYSAKFGMYMISKGKELKDDYMWQAKSQMNKGNHRIFSEEELDVEIELYFGNKRRCDVDNFSKLVLDSLQGVAFEDDSQIYRLSIIKKYDKENPRVEVAIKQL